MPVNINITISGEGREEPKVTGPVPISSGQQSQDLASAMAELQDQMDFAPFPGAGLDAFLSHFVMMVEFTMAGKAGQTAIFNMPVAVQTVSRSAPFIYRGGGEDAPVHVPLPAGCDLSDKISDSDFIERPEGHFIPGRETVFMQILNLDARAETEIGPVRIIIGQTLKNEHPDIFQPSLGAAQALGKSGFPARLFFNPVALVETNFGAFRAVHGTLTYGRIKAFPPIGAAVSITAPVPMEPIEAVRAARKAGSSKVESIGRIISLAHPIDVALQIPGEEAFRIVQNSIGSHKPGGKIGVSGTTQKLD
jgi:hypothetical protein